MRNKVFILITLVIIYTFFGIKREPNINELAYAWAAVASQSVEPCKKIGAASINTYSFNPANKKAKSLRSDCYRSVALETRNEDICKYAEPVSRLRSLIFSGSAFNPELCLTQIKKHQIPSYSLTSDLVAKLMSLYEDNEIYQDCNHRFSTQRENNTSLISTYNNKYNQCITAQTRSSNRTNSLGGLESGPTNKSRYDSVDIEPSFTTKERCKNRLMQTFVKEHYFGKPEKKYPRNREYAHCENYCVIVEFDGYCKEPESEFTYETYKKFLSSQARNGTLIKKLDKSPNYNYW